MVASVGSRSPMLAIHLLIQNLCAHISRRRRCGQMDKEFAYAEMGREKYFGRFALRTPTSSIFDITTFALMWYVFAANNVSTPPPSVRRLVEAVLAHWSHMPSGEKVVIQSQRCRRYYWTTGLIMAIYLCVIPTPLLAAATELYLLASINY